MVAWEEWSTEKLVAAIARLDKESDELTEGAKESRADHPAGLPSLVILAERGRAYEILAALAAEMDRRGEWPRWPVVEGEKSVRVPDDRFPGGNSFGSCLGTLGG